MAQVLWYSDGKLFDANQVDFDDADQIPPEAARFLFGPDKPPTKEEALRRLIEYHPEVLPWREWSTNDELTPRYLVMTRGIIGAATDLLLLESWPDEDDGGMTEDRLVVVECKLARNRESRREVVGQVLEYSSQVIRESLGAVVLAAASDDSTLRKRASEYWEEREGPGAFEREASRALGEKWKEIFKNACKRAGDGDLRLVIASDFVPAELARTIALLPAQVLLGAVEVQLAVGEGAVATRAETATRPVDLEKLRQLCAAVKEELTITLTSVQIASCGGRLLVDSKSHGEAAGAHARANLSIDDFINGAPADWQPIYRDLWQRLESHADLVRDSAGTMLSIKSKAAPASGGGRALIRFKNGDPKKQCFATTAYLMEVEKREPRLPSAHLSQVKLLAEDYVKRLRAEFETTQQKLTAGWHIVFRQEDLAIAAKRAKLLEIANDVAHELDVILESARSER
jgi:hypothetical protein